MCVTLIMGFMLLVILAGYLALIKAHTQGGKLKTIGQVISWIVIITAFIGTVCSTAAIHFNLKPYCYKKGHIYSKTQCDIYQKQCGQNKKFAIVLQAGKETHEGMARAVHALLYAAELKEKGYEVVLIFDGAGTEWAEELSNPDSQSKLLPMYNTFKETGIQEIICDFCTGAFGVKEKLESRQSPVVSEYQGHPSIEKWIGKGYQLIVL